MCTRLATLIIMFLVGISLAAAQNSFLQQEEHPTQSLDSSANVRYLDEDGRTSSVLIRPFILDSRGNTVWICKNDPSFSVILMPDTPYFATLDNANLHGNRFSDLRKMTFHSLLSFLYVVPCGSDGFIRAHGLLPLPYIIWAKYPKALPAAFGTALVAHAQLLANTEIDIALNNSNIVGTQDRIVAGSGVDYSLLAGAYITLPNTSEEGISAERALSAIKRNDLRDAASATIDYVAACVKEEKCSDTLRRELVAEFQKNENWFAFFGTLASAGMLPELSVGVKATSEELALSGIGREFRTAAVSTTADAGATASEINILRAATMSKGDFGLGIASEAQANRVGEAWVGPGYTTSSNGQVWISSDGLRQFRLPSPKSSPLASTGIQANFESRLKPFGEFQSNGHLDVR